MNPDLSNNTTVEQLLAVGRSLAPIERLEGGKPCAIVPDGYALKDAETMLKTPVRKRGRAEFSAFASWVSYVNEHKLKSTRVFAAIGDGTITLTAMLDFHGENPSWHEHHAKFVAKPSIEWLRWAGVNGRPLSQQNLAEFLERSVADVKHPTGAAMLEIVENLSAHVDARFEHKLAVTDGKTRMLYEEDVKVSGGGSSIKPGQMDLPRTIVVDLPVFKHEPAVETTWRLRPSVNNRQVAFTLELPNACSLVEQAAMKYLELTAVELCMKPFIGNFVNFEK